MSQVDRRQGSAQQILTGLGLGMSTTNHLAIPADGRQEVVYVQGASY